MSISGFQQSANKVANVPLILYNSKVDIKREDLPHLTVNVRTHSRNHRLSIE